MSLNEFKTWLEGFLSAIEGTPTEKHLAAIKAKMSEIDKKDEYLEFFKEMAKEFNKSKSVPYFVPVPYYEPYREPYRITWKYYPSTADEPVVTFGSTAKQDNTWYVFQSVPVFSEIPSQQVGYSNFINSQIDLPADFRKILEDNIQDLYA